MDAMTESVRSIDAGRYRVAWLSYTVPVGSRRVHLGAVHRPHRGARRLAGVAFGVARHRRAVILYT
jgi:hypothetical protein